MTENKKHSRPKPLVIAHRGYSAKWPENSASAILAAAEAGADLAELDVRLTSDRIPVCVHDPDLQRLTGELVTVDQVTAQKLQTINRIDNETYLTLDKALQTAEGKIGVLLDLKQYDLDYINIVMDEIERSARDVAVTLGIRSPVLLDEIFGRNRPYETLAFMTDPDDIDTFIRKNGTVVRLWEQDLAPECVEKLHDAGVSVWIMTGGKGTGRQVGDIGDRQLKTIFDMGVDGILINDPEACVKMRENKV